MKFKKVLAATLITTMALSTTVFGASATPEWNNDNGEQTVIGDAQVVQPVLEVALPGDLAFTLDPLKIENDAQVVGGDYNIVNYSTVDVKVTVYPSIVKNDALSVVAAPKGLNDDKTSYKDLDPVDSKKAIHLYVTPADTTTTLTDTNEDGIYEFAYTSDATEVGRAAFVAGGTQEAPTWTAANKAGEADNGIAVLAEAEANAKSDDSKSMIFYLQTPTFDGEVLDKTANKGITAVTSFTVGGCADPSSIFYEGEVQIQAVYKMEMLSDNEVTTLLGDTNANKSTKKLNAIKNPSTAISN